MSDALIARTTAAQTARNIGLVGRLLEEALDDEAAFDRIPDGGKLVVIPYDDPGLGLLNLALASRLAGRGETVHLHRVGLPDEPSERWPMGLAPEVEPQWPADWSVSAPRYTVYDREEDELTTSFYPEPREGRIVPISDYVALVVELDTNEIVGQFYPNFLSHTVARNPRMIDALALAALKGITREEVDRMRREQVADANGVDADELAGALAQLIA